MLIANESFGKGNFETLGQSNAGRVARFGDGNHYIDRRQIQSEDLFGEKTAEKVLRSAIANYQNKDEAGRVDTATLFVKEAFVDGGATAKRVSAAPMGRAYRIRKRSNHITIIVAQRPAAVKTAKAAKRPEARSAAPVPAATEATVS